MFGKYANSDIPRVYETSIEGLARMYDGNASRVLKDLNVQYPTGPKHDLIVAALEHRADLRYP